jgi:uncharacterized protein (DUF58 family)
VHLTTNGRITLVGGIVIFLGGLILGFTVVVGTGLALMGAVGLSMLLVLEPPSMTVQRRTEPSEVDRGGPAQVTLEFQTTSRGRPRPFLVIENVVGERRVAAMPAIPAGQSHSFSYDLDTSRRGNLIVGPLVLRRVDVMGLVVAERRISGTATLAVRPRRYPLRMLPTGRRRDLEGPTRESSAGTASFHQLREYVPGDDLRLIHWRSTAKTGTLVVKQMVDTTRPEILVILDNRSVAINTDDFETAVDIAASVLQAAEQDGFPYQLLFSDGDNSVTVDGQPIAYIDRLTAVEVTATDSLFELTEAIRARGRSLVFITGELHSADMSLVARLARSFSPCVIISVVKDRRTPFVTPLGVHKVACATADDFLQQWRTLRT